MNPSERPGYSDHSVFIPSGILEEIGPYIEVVSKHHLYTKKIQVDGIQLDSDNQGFRAYVKETVAVEIIRDALRHIVFTKNPVNSMSGHCDVLGRVIIFSQEEFENTLRHLIIELYKARLISYNHHPHKLYSIP